MNDGYGYVNDCHMGNHDNGRMDSWQANGEPNGYYGTYDGYCDDGGYDNGYVNDFVPMDQPCDNGPISNFDSFGQPIDYCYEGDDSTWESSQHQFQEQQQEEIDLNLQELFSNFMRTHFDRIEALNHARKYLKEMLASQQKSIQSLEKVVSSLLPLVEDFVSTSISPPTTPVVSTSWSRDWNFHNDDVSFYAKTEVVESAQIPAYSITNDEDDEEDDEVFETLSTPDVFKIYDNPLSDGKDDSDDDCEDDSEYEVEDSIPGTFKVYNNPLGSTRVW
ncbi:uncharacterized protein [Rutidosis leptorrhynchoides]|uniref:uncharacterized protein n=1 Tax=Rutidosis leptorrhynchoides TaxID=125765 RepID=UPI003A99CD92